jgi:hypothetical protein
MDRETDRFIRTLNYRSMAAAEISGDKWKDFGFASYLSLPYPDFDVCAPPPTNTQFDLVLVEQVLEHVLWPYRAARTLHAITRPGGWVVVTTPFLVKIHEVPVDCSRWTPLGMRHLLAEGGFRLEDIQAGSWGNRSCARASYRRIPRYRKGWHTISNDPKYPLVVWAFARRAREVVT